RFRKSISRRLHRPNRRLCLRSPRADIRIRRREVATLNSRAQPKAGERIGGPGGAFPFLRCETTIFQSRARGSENNSCTITGMHPVRERIGDQESFSSDGKTVPDTRSWSLGPGPLGPGPGWDSPDLGRAGAKGTVKSRRGERHWLKWVG